MKRYIEALYLRGARSATFQERRPSATPGQVAAIEARFRRVCAHCGSEELQDVFAGVRCQRCRTTVGEMRVIDQLKDKTIATASSNGTAKWKQPTRLPDKLNGRSKEGFSKRRRRHRVG